MLHEIYRTCTCATGHLVSAINLNHNPDLTYAYSRHLLWGIAETTTAVLVFCIPAMPIAFRGPGLTSRIHAYLRSKIRVYPHTQALSSGSIQGHAWPRATSEWGANRERHTMEECDGIHLTELQPVRTAIGHSIDGIPESSTNEHGGILIRTEIQVVTGEESGSAMPAILHRDPLRPWLDDR